MATILAFKREADHRSAALPPGHSAQVYFFTGVRYERPEVDRAKPVAARSKRRRGAGPVV